MDRFLARRSVRDALVLAALAFACWLVSLQFDLFDLLVEFDLFAQLFPASGEALKRNPEYTEKLIREALINTDDRIHDGKSVTPAFLFAAMLWPMRASAPPGRAATVTTGLASGLLTGFAGMPGPPVVPFYVRRHIPRATAKASMVLIFTCASFAGIGSGLVMGIVTWRLALLAMALFPVVLVGNWLGARMSGRVGDTTWRAFAAVVLGAAALAALLKLLLQG